jgi:hypothetical protein
MHFMSPADRLYVGIIAPGKPLEALMNDHLVNHEIGKPIGHHSKPDRLQPENRINRAYQYAGEAWYREDYKEPIVFLKKTSVFLCDLHEDTRASRDDKFLLSSCRFAFPCPWNRVASVFFAT